MLMAGGVIRMLVAGVRLIGVILVFLVSGDRSAWAIAWVDVEFCVSKFGPGTGIRPVPGTGMLVAGVPGICGDGF